MRYAKASLSISSTRDIPILLEVRNSRFIGHDQLYELMYAGSYEHSRRSFNWRVRRLLDAKYITACRDTCGRGALVYCISREGLHQLESAGNFAAVFNSNTHQLVQMAQIHHALELNSVRIALAKAQVLASWRSDVETASMNTVSSAAQAKDYDAIVDVWNGSNLARFALEYERTLKSGKRYAEIRHALNNDSDVGCVLYLTSGFDVSCHLLNQFAGIPKRLAITTAVNFRNHLLDTPVMTDPERPQVAFRALLHGIL